VKPEDLSKYERGAGTLFCLISPWIENKICKTKIN